MSCKILSIINHSHHDNKTSDVNAMNHIEAICTSYPFGRRKGRMIIAPKIKNTKKHIALPLFFL